jgi:iron complex outermembrane receptor protein
VLNQAIVCKTSQANIVDGGGVYVTLPDKTSPNINATFHWIGPRFAYGANSGRDTINTSTMRAITDASLAGTGYRASDMNGVRIPGSMSSEYVEGARTVALLIWHTAAFGKAKVYT